MIGGVQTYFLGQILCLFIVNGPVQSVELDFMYVSVFLCVERVNSAWRALFVWTSVFGHGLRLCTWLGQHAELFLYTLLYTLTQEVLCLGDRWYPSQKVQAILAVVRFLRHGSHWHRRKAEIGESLHGGTLPPLHTFYHHINFKTTCFSQLLFDCLASSVYTHQTSSRVCLPIIGIQTAQSRCRT